MLHVTGLLTSPETGSVLADVDLSVARGQVHGLAGERAATSAVVHLLAGDAVSDGGRIEIDGRQHTFGHPARAQRAGVWTVRTRVDLHPARTIAESVAVNHETRRPVGAAHPHRDLGAFLRGLGLSHLPPHGTVGELAAAEQRLVEIARAAYHDARVVILDRLEGGWASREAEPVHEVLGRLVARGIAVLYVTQQRQEIYDLCDSFTVLGAAADGLASVVELSRSTDDHKEGAGSWPTPALMHSSSV